MFFSVVLEEEKKGILSMLSPEMLLNHCADCVIKCWPLFIIR